MERIKLGVIGCGIAAKKLHLPALQKLRDKIEVVCVCNHTEPKAKEFGQLVGGVPYVLDYRELLAREDVEAVLIILPIYLNCRVVEDSLKAGKHVIAEKPLAANLEEGRRLLGFPQQYDRVMMIAENFRYHKLILRTKEYLEEGKVGRPYGAFWNNFMYFDISGPYGDTQWRWDHKHIGGIITDGGVHNVAALRLLFGEITSISSLTWQINPQMGQIDSLSMQFQTEAGVKGVLNNFFTVRGLGQTDLLVLGTEASLVMGRDRIIWKRPDQEDVEEVVESDGGYSGQLEDFCRCVREGAEPVSSFAEAYRDLEVMVRAVENAGKAVCEL